MTVHVKLSQKRIFSCFFVGQYIFILSFTVPLLIRPMHCSDCVRLIMFDVVHHLD